MLPPIDPIDRAVFLLLIVLPECAALDAPASLAKRIRTTVTHAVGGLPLFCHFLLLPALDGHVADSIGRQRTRRFSNAVISTSVISATAARITIAAKTPFALKLAPAFWIIKPMPCVAPRNSPTTAPTSAKLKLVCRLARIHVKADGMITSVESRRWLAPRIC